MNVSLAQAPETFRLLLVRISRRETVEQGVFLLRLFFSCLGALFIFLIIFELVAGRLQVRSAAKTLANEIKSPSDIGTSEGTKTGRGNYSLIVSRNIFGELGSRATSTQTQVKPITKLPLILIGTFISEGEEPYAIIEDDKKKLQDVFKRQEMVFGDAKLVSIMNDRVEISRNGQIEVLKLDDAPDPKGSSGPGVSSASGSDEFVVDEGELDKALENLPLLLTQARAVPYFKDGKSVGLRLFAIKSGSLFEKVGLMNGDILKSINGNSLADISQAMKLFEMLKSERSIEVNVERNREERAFKYQIR